MVYFDVYTALTLCECERDNVMCDLTNSQNTERLHLVSSSFGRHSALDAMSDVEKRSLSVWTAAAAANSSKEKSKQILVYVRCVCMELKLCVH